MDEITENVVDNVADVAADNTVALLIVGALLGLGVGGAVGWKWRKRKSNEVDDEPKQLAPVPDPPKEEKD